MKIVTLCSPIPKGIGAINCVLRRKKLGLFNIHPKFILMLAVCNVVPLHFFVAKELVPDVR